MDISKLLAGLETVYSPTSTTVTVRLTADLLSELDAVCTSANTTRSKVIKAALKHYLTALNTLKITPITSED